MSAGVLDLDLEQGTTFTQALTWQDNAGNPINLTSYSARMQIRPTVTSTTVSLELLTTNGGITLGGSAGTITLTMTATQTAALTIKTGVYDLELVSAGGVVTRLLKGAVNVDPEVTR